MWTIDKKFDTCERCIYNLIVQKHELRRALERRAGGQFVNPFAGGPANDSHDAMLNQGSKLL